MSHFIAVPPDRATDPLSSAYNRLRRRRSEDGDLGEPAQPTGAGARVAQTKPMFDQLFKRLDRIKGRDDLDDLAVKDDLQDLAVEEAPPPAGTWVDRASEALRSREFDERGNPTSAVTRAFQGAGRTLFAPIAMAAEAAKPPNPESGFELATTGMPGGQAVLAAKRLLWDPQVQSFERAVDAYQQGDYANVLRHGVAGAVPLFGPMAAQFGEQLERGDVAGTLTEVGTGALAPKAFQVGKAKVLDPMLKRAEAGLNARRQRLASKELLQVAKPSAKKYAAAQQDVQTALPDIADAARAQGLKLRGNERVGELAELLETKAQEVWDQHHIPPVQRQAKRPVDVGRLREAALREIGEADRRAEPQQVATAEAWVEEALSQPMDVQLLDDFIRRLNASNRQLPETFGAIGKRVRHAVLRASRDLLDDTLEAQGERGVREGNRRWGALTNLADHVRGQVKAAELHEVPGLEDLARRPVGLVTGAVAGSVSPGLGTAAGAAAGMAADAAHLVMARRRAPGATAARALDRLSRTELAGEPPAAPGRGPITDPARLLPPATTIFAPQSSGPSGPQPRGTMGVEAMRETGRDVATGKFKRVYTGEGKKPGSMRMGLDPADVKKTTGALKSLMSQIKKKGSFKGTLWDKLANEGRESAQASFTPAEITELQQLKGYAGVCKVGECIKNAQTLALAALDDPRVKYMEGLVDVHGVPIDHAWLEFNGKVYDPTLYSYDRKGNRSVNTKMSEGRRALLRGSKPELLEHEYHGVEVPKELIAEHQFKTERYDFISHSPEFAAKVWGKSELPQVQKVFEPAPKVTVRTPPTRELKVGETTETIWKNPHTDGWDQARSDFHHDVANNMIAEKLPRKTGKPVVTIMGGGTGTGKTTLSKMLLPNRQHLVEIDADIVKLEIPEYGQLQKTFPEEAASMVHEESSRIAKLAMAKAAARGLDILYDATSSGKGIMTAIQKLHKEGYRVSVNFTDAPVELSIQRAVKRSKNPLDKSGFGRVVPDQLMRTSHRRSIQNFIRIKDMPEVDSVKLYDTSITPPQLVYERSGKQVKVHNPKKLKDYERRARQS